MKKTIEVLEEHGLIEKFKKMFNLIPTNMVDDIEKDPDMKKTQVNLLAFSTVKKMDEDEEFINQFFNAVFEDIVDKLDLKKEGEGNAFLKSIFEIFKELN